jgi:hypothetical protein
MIANISDYKDTVFLSNNDVFSLEIKFLGLKNFILMLIFGKKHVTLHPRVFSFKLKTIF